MIVSETVLPALSRAPTRRVTKWRTAARAGSSRHPSSHRLRSVRCQVAPSSYDTSTVQAPDGGGGARQVRGGHRQAGVPVGTAGFVGVHAVVELDERQEHAASLPVTAEVKSHSVSVCVEYGSAQVPRSLSRTSR